MSLSIEVNRVVHRDTPTQKPCLSVDNASLDLRGYFRMDTKGALDSLRLGHILNLAVGNMTSIEVSVNGARSKYVVAVIGNLASIKDTGIDSWYCDSRK